jgi:hypothetical protein
VKEEAMSINHFSDEVHFDFDYKAMMDVWNLSKDKDPELLRKRREAERELCLQKRAKEVSQGSFWARLAAFASGRAGHEYCDD